MTNQRRLLAESTVFALVALAGGAFSVANGPIAFAQVPVTPDPNPPIAKACGIDVTLVLDASGSVQQAGAVGKVRQAAAELLDALKGTSSTARVLQFATLAEQLSPRVVVDDDSMGDGGDLDDAVDGYFSPQPQRPADVTIKSYDGSGDPDSTSNWTTANSNIQYTNWHQALNLTATDTAELVVFITDGDPTAYDLDRVSDPFDQGPPPDVAINTDRTTTIRDITQQRSILAANSVKALNSRVLAIGVGSALQNEASVQRLTQVSGPNIARTTAQFDIQTTDVALIEDFDALADGMRTLVLDLCSPSLTIRKFAQSATNALYLPAPGWDFTVTPTVAGGFTWVLPTGVTGGSTTVATDAQGFAQFQWEPNVANTNSSALVSEDLLPGFIPGRPNADHYFCQFKDVDGEVRIVSGELTRSGGSASFNLPTIGAEIGTCSIYNSFDYQLAINLEKENTPAEVRGDLEDPAVVTSTYTITNPTQIGLIGITLVDSRCSEFEPPLGVEPPNPGDSNGNFVLEFGESWVVTCDRDAVTDLSPPGGVQVTNSALVRGTGPNGAFVTASDSASVSVFLPSVTLSKLVEGEEEIEVTEGDSVTYTYTVTNTGNTALGSVTLVDDQPPCTSPTRTDPDPVTGPVVMAPGDVWSYACVSDPLTQVVLPVVNVAIVTATPLSPSAGNAAFPPPNPVVTATDSAVVTVLDPDLVLTKSVDQSLVFPGASVTYTYLAENTGTADLSNPDAAGNPGWVTDNKCDSVEQVIGVAPFNLGDTTPADGLINPGETWQFRCTTDISTRTINVGTIVTQPVDTNGDPVGGRLTARDFAVVNVLDPEIQVVKTALVSQVLTADPTPNHPPLVGPDVPDPRPAEYKYEVINTGNTPLTEVDLSDSHCVDVELDSGDDGDLVLELDEIWVYLCETGLERQQSNSPPLTGNESGFVTNTATVTAIPVLPEDPEETGPEVRDTDTAQVLVIEPGLLLTKTASASVVRAGDEVTYTVTITNTGDIGLYPIGPFDSKCPDLTYVSGDLPPANGLIDGANGRAVETWTYTCTREVSMPDEGSLDTNTAAVFALDSLGGTQQPGNLYTSSDSVDVRVIDPAITLVKSVSEELVPSGTQVTYSFDVTNSGTSAVAADDVLAGVTLTDVAVPATPDCNPSLVSKTGGNQDQWLDRDPPETWHYECTAVITESTNNVGLTTARGGTQLGLNILVADTSQAFVQAFHPAIDVTKAAAPITIQGSGSVVYTYTVRNTGDVPLAGVAARISDNTCSPLAYVSGDEDADGLLDTINSIFEDALDETWTFTCTTTISQTTTNIVVVTGSPTDQTGGPLCGQTGNTPRIPATCDVTDQATATVTVTPGGGVLPPTGSNSTQPISMWALMALSAGVALFAGARRRLRRTP